MTFECESLQNESQTLSFVVEKKTVLTGIAVSKKRYKKTPGGNCPFAGDYCQRRINTHLICIESISGSSALNLGFYGTQEEDVRGSGYSDE